MTTLRGKVVSLRKKRVHLPRHGVQGGDFNPDLWSSLPEALIVNILAKLPFPSLVRLSSVCKWWRDLILHSKGFPRCSSKHARLFYFDEGKLVVFCPGRGHWEVVSLQFLQVNLELYFMVMSTGGLLCFCSRDGGEFIVCNPLTKCHRRLLMPWREASEITDQPCMPAPEPKGRRRFEHMLGFSLLVGMVVDSDTGHFKLIVGGFFPASQGTTLVYDSRVNSWKKAADIPDAVLQVGLFRASRHHRFMCEKSQPMACGGNLYFYFQEGYRFQRLFKYDVDEELWSWIPMPRVWNDTHNIMEQGGKVVLVISKSSSLRTRRKSVECEALELQDVGSELWLPTNHSPFSRLLEREMVPDETRCDCLGQGDAVFFIKRELLWSESPKKTRVREWFCNVATVADGISNFEDYQGEQEIKIFMPSTILLTEGG